MRVLVISGDSHVFTFEPETTVGRMKELIWSMWPSSQFRPTSRAIDRLSNPGSSV